MPAYPKLKTKIKGFTLEPLESKHSSSLLSILNDPDIQKTLFRTPRVVQDESITKMLEGMYGDKVKEITYLLALSKNRIKTIFGYVKIKLIDWSNMSCYLSVAILNTPEFRGQGYSTACYDSFFEYLFSLGFLKIYGRTYEENTPTIKLNFRTGFRFIGRQKHFLVKKGQSTQDALFFERLNPQLETSYTNMHSDTLLPLYRKLKEHISNELPLQKLERPLNGITELNKWTENNGSYLPKFKYDTKEIQETIQLNQLILIDLEETLNKVLPLHWRKYLEYVTKSVQDKIELLKSIGTATHERLNSSYHIASENTFLNSNTFDETILAKSSKKNNVLKGVVLQFQTTFGKGIAIEESPNIRIPEFLFTKNKLLIPTLHHLTNNEATFYLTYAAIIVSQYLNGYASGFQLLSLPLSSESMFHKNEALYLACMLGDVPKQINDYISAIGIIKKLQKFHIARIPKQIFAKLKDPIVNDALHQSVIGINKNKLIFTKSFETTFVSFLEKNHFSIDSILSCPLSAKEKEILSSVFLGRDLQYNFETILRLRKRISEILTP